MPSSHGLYSTLSKIRRMSERMGDTGVSIIVPCHFANFGVVGINALRRALDGIHDQRCSQAYEVILVDDGSIVPVQSLDPMLGASRLRFTRMVRHGRHLGSSHAFNTGLAQARYSWIVPFDLDEPWAKDTLETQLTRARADPDLSFCARRIASPEIAGTEAGSHDRLDEWSKALHSFADVARPFSAGSVLARTDVFRLLGGFSHDPRSSHRDEYSLWSTWFRFFKPALLEDTKSVAPSSRAQSEIVLRRFSDLGVRDDIPLALCSLAGLLGCTVLEAGKLAYVMWRFRPRVRMPKAALSSLQYLMPDRRVLVASPKASVAPEQIIPGLVLSLTVGDIFPLQATL